MAAEWTGSEAELVGCTPAPSGDESSAWEVVAKEEPKIEESVDELATSLQSVTVTCVEDDVDFSPDPPKEDGDVTNPSTAPPSEQKEPDVSTSTTEKPTTATADDPPATDTTANAPPADPSDSTVKKKTLGLSALQPLEALEAKERRQ